MIFLYSLKLDITLTLILAIILFIIGTFIKNKVSLLEKFCIPSPVVGGLLFCILTLFLRLFNICDITMDTSLMDYLICFFFTTIGIGMSMNLVKKGGKSLIRYWLLCGALSLFQNLIAVFTSKAININPLIGLMCGTISMEGRHGSAAAYGATIESLGIDNAISVGIASSTLGLILAGLIGAPLAKYLIDKYKLKAPSNSSAISISHKDNKISSSFGEFEPGLKGNYKLSNLNDIFPKYIRESLIEAIDEFNKKIKGFNREDAILAAIESRTSSPVRIERDDNFESNIKGIYPCGEGAGYAGGITSAAVDGIKIAEAVATNVGDI